MKRDPLLEIDARVVEHLAETGATINEIVKHLNCARSVFMQRKSLDADLADAYRRGREAYAASQGARLVKTGNKLMVAGGADLALAGLDRSPDEAVLQFIRERGGASWTELLRETRLNENALGLIMLRLILDRREVRRIDQDGEDRSYLAA